MKHQEEAEEDEEMFDEADPEKQKLKVRESIYETVLSLDIVLVLNNLSSRSRQVIPKPIDLYLFGEYIRCYG